MAPELSIYVHFKFGNLLIHYRPWVTVRQATEQEINQKSLADGEKGTSKNNPLKKKTHESLRLISKGKEFSGIKKWSTVCKKQSTV